MSLPSGQLFAFYKVDEGFIICEDLHEDFDTLQIWLSIFKAMNNYQQLLVIDLSDKKLTLFDINLQAGSLKLLKNISNIFNMFLLSLAVDENIIQVYLSIVIETFKESVINVMLKGGQSVD